MVVYYNFRLMSAMLKMREHGCLQHYIYSSGANGIHNYTTLVSHSRLQQQNLFSDL